MNLTNPRLSVLDVRGLPCPQPVILARKALAAGGFETLELLVDDAASRENLLKFGAYAKCEVECLEGEGGSFRIRLRPQGQALEHQEVASSRAPVPGASRAEVVLLTADGIGKGDPELAHLLMRGFLYTLTEAEALPQRLLLMNAGVKLAVEGSDSLGSLAQLAERGVEVLACGTCLEFYKLTDALRVGGITNMYEIAEALLNRETLSLG